MVKIRITAGTFGLKNTLVKAGDPPIEVDDAVARRLVEDKHAAEYVEAPAPAETQSDGGSAGDSSAQSIEDMGMPELRKLGAEYGLTFKVGTSKVEMAKQIQQAMNSAQDSSCDNVDDAPQFNAADAVQ